MADSGHSPHAQEGRAGKVRADVQNDLKSSISLHGRKAATSPHRTC